jgi:hypothetical protein
MFGYYSENLTTINVASSNKNYTSVDGVLFTKDMKTLIKYPMKKIDTCYVIPNGVEVIDFRAMANSYYLTEITIPLTIKSFREYSLYCCESLAKINYRGSQAQWNKLEFDLNWDYIDYDFIDLEREIVYNYKGK